MAELVGIDVAKQLTMTAEVISGKEARELGLVTGLDADPLAAADALIRRLGDRSPTSSRPPSASSTTPGRRARGAFARERVEQARLLFARNTRIAREAATKRIPPEFRPRAR